MTPVMLAVFFVVLLVTPIGLADVVMLATIVMLGAFVMTTITAVVMLAVVGQNMAQDPSGGSSA